MPPTGNGYFHEVQYINEQGELVMTGELGRVEKDTERILVLAVVSQQPIQGEQATTVSGEALLKQDQLDFDVPLTGVWADGHYARTIGKKRTWECAGSPPKGRRLEAGEKAFGSAIKVEFKKDGSVETYGWFGWVTLEDWSKRP